ncbi:MAG: hypothetical protein FWC91_14765 [Defluviitaleaceae bacterium]|nr:hypothetical protein [Defluviitaleaceae bacterium]
MAQKLIDYISNPVTFKLLIEMQEQKQTTARKLAKVCSDIPQASLYRYLNRMLNDDIIKVVKENKIRGMVEKVYELNMPLHIDKEKFKNENSREEFLQLVTQITMSILRDFKEYTVKEDFDTAGDGSLLWSIPLYLTKMETDEVLAEVQSVLKSRFDNTPTSERKLRNINIIISPPKNFEVKSENVGE